MELKGENPFKISAFRKAAAALETDDRSLSEIEDFTKKIGGIGKGTAAVIIEYIEAGESSVLEELEKGGSEYAHSFIKAAGSWRQKKLAKLYKELGVTDIASLQQACEEQRVQALAGFGKKTEEKILEAIAQFGTRPERLPIADVLPIASEIERRLSEILEVERFFTCGKSAARTRNSKGFRFLLLLRTILLRCGMRCCNFLVLKK
ncbi:hypothetical protein GCM10020331_033390 [Ectobacillus funiculus]